jgi:dihydroxy-acid dehydratase
MEPQLRKHTGPAVVFRDYNDMSARIDSPDLQVTKDSVIVLQSAGPQGAPGMPEWGQLPIPQKLLKDGVRDMVRISDARMSGTSYGACVLHVTPESHVGGPFALVRDGDLISLDVEARRIDMLVEPAELARRQAAWKEPAPKFTRGYGVLYLKHVRQADTGCDFDFLEPDVKVGEAGGEPEIH